MDEHKMSINEAKTVLLDFKVQSEENLEKALEVMYKHEEPEHYEEWGQSDGKNYFYSKDIFKKAGIIIHKNDNKITNVEKYWDLDSSHQILGFRV